jgi:hypothetical protein
MSGRTIFIIVGPPEPASQLCFRFVVSLSASAMRRTAVNSGSTGTFVPGLTTLRSGIAFDQARLARDSGFRV